LGLAAPWVVLLLLSGGGGSAAVWNSPGGIAVLCAGAGMCVIAYLAMKALGRLSADPRNLGGEQ
ncbi:MAG: type II secretion system protein F, partial [Pauljensenia sp.]